MHCSVQDLQCDRDLMLLTVSQRPALLRGSGFTGRLTCGLGVISVPQGQLHVGVQLLSVVRALLAARLEETQKWFWRPRERSQTWCD